MVTCLAELIIELLQQHYEKYVIREGNTKIIYIQMLKALYGMMVSSLLFYRHFRKDLDSMGYVVNPNDIFVANRNIEGTQQTITWHLDNVNVNHKSAKVNKEFCEWCETKYGSKSNGHVKTVIRKIHDYLAMITLRNERLSLI